MRFVWIAKENPLPADSGGRLYSNGLLRSLLRTGATGSLIAYATDSNETTPVPNLEQHLLPPQRKSRLLSLFSTLQSDAFRLKGDAMNSLLKGIIPKNLPDAVIIDYFSMGWCLPTIQNVIGRMSYNPALVYITHNYEPFVRHDVATSSKNPVLRQILKLDAIKAATLDLQVIRAADIVVTNTEEDKISYLKHAHDQRIIVLSPAYDGEIIQTRPIDKRLPRQVVIVGAFDWIAKQMILRRFLEAAAPQFTPAGITLLVVGRAPQPFIKDLSAKYTFCTFTGRVDDVRPHLANARIGIMPDDVGGGFKHKYLYYIFAGLPIATIRSQFVGMPLDAERDVIARSNVVELVQSIVENIDNIGKLEAMRKHCWETCARLFDWDDRGRLLRKEIDHVTSSRTKIPHLSNSIV